ncbi:MAG TPA: APC family permease, partial [Opitutaceae bacterium]|nr:APC family permease [Opitutaceae bacterium]
MSIRSLFFGRARSLSEENLFHNLSLVALLAWVGLGADGLSSSCYGPEETFKALGANHHLAIFVALASVVTIVAICASYSQTIALFPSGGGGYLVASKLLSPAAGVVSGSALLVDYVLTITISIASGADALFSLPMLAPWLQWKLVIAYAGVIGLTLINLRGVKESVMLWVPVFFLFVLTHAFAIVYALSTHAGGLVTAAHDTVHEVHLVSGEVGVIGLLALILRAYSLGAGTYTGIEAVSNGLPILREPRVHTGRVTMVYMGVSLAVTVAGLLVAYLLFHCEPVAGKTLNAVLFDKMTAGWPHALGSSFVWITLASEAVLLFIAAQAGFVDGPRVLANMALDRWLPTRFANLSDRLVTQNGIVLMGVAAALMMMLTEGSVDALVVLYSINVFLTFSLSQLGMVVHWWQERRRDPTWLRKLAINGFGLVLTTFILISLTVIKFFEGAWITVLVTGALIGLAFLIRRHYRHTTEQLRRLDSIVDAAAVETTSRALAEGAADPKGRTAILLVNGFNGLGLHTALHVPRLFGNTFRNFVFISVGAVDAGNFKGADELESLRTHTLEESARYADWARAHGFGTATFNGIGHDVMGEVMRLAREAKEAFPNSVFFAGQLLFAKETWINRVLHNSTAFTLQRRFFLANLPF